MLCFGFSLPESETWVREKELDLLQIFWRRRDAQPMLDFCFFTNDWHDSWNVYAPARCNLTQVKTFSHAAKWGYFRFLCIKSAQCRFVFSKGGIFVIALGSRVKAVHVLSFTKAKFR